MPIKIVAGNWKMNLNLKEGVELVNGICSNELPSDVRVIVFPPSLFVDRLSEIKNEEIAVGVQNFHPSDKGAFTGEFSISQVKNVGASIGLIGHSERRGIFGENNELVKMKVDSAIRNDFEFIFCCGESLEIRESGAEIAFVKNQLESSLFHLSSEQIKNGIIAYEPIWAIGTGRTASSQQAEDMHSEIRAMITDRYDSDTASSISILYGGSCKPENAKELFACANVDGGLIGGASLNTDSFCAIIDSF